MKIIIEVEVKKIAGITVTDELRKNENVKKSLKKLAKKYSDGTDNYFKKAKMRTETKFRIE